MISSFSRLVGFFMHGRTLGVAGLALGEAKGGKLWRGLSPDKEGE